MLATRLLDKCGYPRHFFIILCNETFESFRIVNKTCFGLLGYEIHNLRKNGVGRGKQLRMIAGAALVPVAERFPFVSVLPRTKNIALGGENEIGADGKCEIGDWNERCARDHA